MNETVPWEVWAFCHRTGQTELLYQARTRLIAERAASRLEWERRDTHDSFEVRGPAELVPAVPR
jgi:hypothetical protein